MKKVKNQGIIYFLLIAVFAITVQSLYGQDYLSKERENEIKTSGNYYWGEGSDFIEDLAKASASAELSIQIIQDAVGQLEQVDEILKTIDTGAHLDRIPQQGKIKILAWIPKESVLLTVAVKRPITQLTSERQLVVPVEEVIVIEEEYIPFQEEYVTPFEAPSSINNPVLRQLAVCKTYGDVRRVATMNGLVRGELGAGSKGFSNPTNCIIAVFTAGGVLSALLDTGNYSRIDLLSGNTIQNPEQYFSQGEYYLWYMQQKD
ncbi:MAG: hypothetical protein LBI82_07560 [Dysgonamonadaceae bacterium]|jgi:hypothetical protein|nr:hypothetical protein [Dysgonamonadaceae bacterium]